MRTCLPSAALLAACALPACLRPVDVTPVTAVLDPSVALGLAGSIAMTSIAGEGPPCVTLTPPCTAAPCLARVEVAVSEACPLALGSGGGTIILDGEWTDADTATFVPDLTAIDVGVRDGEVALGIGVAAVTRDGDDVTIAFASQSAEAGDDTEAAQEGWVVTARLGGTPADPTDDVLELSGAGQTAGASDGDATVRQLAITLTVTDPACRRNPVEGNATVNDVGVAGAQTSLLFHGACDGAADVAVSSADPTQIGKAVDLGY